MAERDLYDPIIAHCQKVLPRCRLFTHGKSFRDEHGVWRNAALCVGMADLVGWVDGHWLEVEVKTAKGTQEKSQRAHEALVRSHGGIYVVARSPEEAERLVRAELARRQSNAHLTITLLEGELAKVTRERDHARAALAGRAEPWVGSD